MSKRDELVAKYKAELERVGAKVDDDLLMRAVKACGPSIYNDDGETIAASSKEELERVRNNFCGKRLGVTDAARADAAIEAAIEKVGKSNRNKYRAVMYYLIAQDLGATDKL